jgi:hypothetical protein
MTDKNRDCACASKQPIITFQARPTLDSALRDEAERRGITKSDLIRQILHKHLEDETGGSNQDADGETP